MKKYLIILFVVSFLSNCTKDTFVEPKSDFNFRGEDVSTFVMATLDTCSLFNTSLDGVSYSWDFGDGRQSEEKQPVISYETSGNYLITLTAEGENGSTSQSSKQIQIVDRVLKKILIKTVHWDTINPNGWPKDTIVDLFFQIQDYTDLYEPSLKIYPNCEVLYNSDTIQNIPMNYNIPIEIYLNEKFVLERNKLNFLYGDYNLGHAYIFSIMGIDSNNNTFCIHNNHGGGGNSFSITKENLSTNEFVVQFGHYFSEVHLICDYE